MDFLLSLTALVFVLVAGVGISLLLLPGTRRTSPVELLVLSFLFGSGFVSVTFFLFSFVSKMPLQRWLVAFCCVMIGAIGAAPRRWMKLEPKASVPQDLRDVFLSAVVLLQVTAIAWLALHSVLGWDGLIIWEYKARLAFINGGRIPFSYFRDITEQWTHHEYPLYLPLTEAWLYTWLGRTDQAWVKAVSPIFYACAAGLLFIGGSRLGRHRWQGFLAAILLFFVPYAVGEVGGPSGYCDFPIAVFYLACLIYVIEYFESGARGAMRVATILAALLTWVKMEGIILWTIIAALLSIEAIRRRHWKALPQVLLPGGFLFVGWKVFLASVHCPPSGLYMPVTMENFLKNAWRIKGLSFWMAAESVNWSRWTLLWPLLIVSLFYLGRKTLTKTYLSLIAAIAVPVVLYTATYVFTNWQPYMQHVESSLPRLLLAPATVALLIIASAEPKRALVDASQTSVNSS